MSALAGENYLMSWKYIVRCTVSIRRAQVAHHGDAAAITGIFYQLTFWLSPFGPWLMFLQYRELILEQENLKNDRRWT